MSQKVINLNESNFEAEVKQEQKAVLVDFWASWCGPCLMVAPAVEKLAEDMQDTLKVCKVNVDENQKLASDFGVMSIPTLILFKSGEEKERIVGALSEPELKDRISNHIG
jgi:thioredoxin 1